MVRDATWFTLVLHSVRITQTRAEEAIARVSIVDSVASTLDAVRVGVTRADLAGLVTWAEIHLAAIANKALEARTVVLNATGIRYAASTTTIRKTLYTMLILEAP